MTNRELLATPEDQLSSSDRQRRHLLQLANIQRPCPACNFPVNVFDASGNSLDDYDFGATDYRFVCPGCRAELVREIPVIGFTNPWLWRLDPEWLLDQLEKAKAWDEQRKEES